LRLNHIGVIVKNISDSVTYYETILGLKKVSEIYVDTRQEVELVFLETGIEGITIELISPTSSSSPAYNALIRGGGINHLCYEVNDINGKIDYLRRQGCKLVRSPLPAIAFGNRLVAFLYSSNLGLIELLEC